MKSTITSERYLFAYEDISDVLKNFTLREKYEILRGTFLLELIQLCFKKEEDDKNAK